LKTRQQNKTNKRKQNIMDPLNLDLSGVDTTPDRLNNKAKVIVQITEAAIEESKKTPGNHNLKVVFATVNDEASQRGGTLKAGYQLRTYMPLQQSQNPDAPDFKVGLARLLDAVFNTPEARPNLNGETLLAMKDRLVQVTVKLEESEDFGLSNSVSRIDPVIEG
jgi:hypothetical protein